jgi:crotonobetainyl-CoA:carnitine CoA-transferase CaiB-like acyl-CoA transferase
MTVPLLHFDYGGKATPRVGLNHPSIHPYGAYETTGAPILIAVQNEREFVRLCSDVLGDAGLAKDPRFATNEARVRNRAAFDAVIARVFTATDRARLIDRLKRAQIAFGEVNDVAALSRHPALRRTEIATPSGTARLVAPPARFDRRERSLGGVPKVGEHSEFIRKEFAA